MRPDNNDRDDHLPLTVAKRIDEICMRFEAAWQKGQAPCLEEYLGDAEGPERAAMLRDLLRVELELRPRHNGVPAVEEYLARFPDHESLIRKEFERHAACVNNKPQPGDTPGTGSAGAAATPAPAISRPVTEVGIPGYEVRRRLGIGGMGIVYEALQVKASRLVALKVIRSGAEADPEELKRFRGEAENAARLQHPNIAQIFEVGEHNGQPYFSMELCGASSLDHYLRGGPLIPAEAAALVETLARAIHHAHQEKVIHRDLKPANILLSPARATDAETGTADTSTEEGRVSLSSLLPKVGDFGLARKLDTGGQTVSGAVLGTPSYMAPEQASGRNKELGPPCDVYALGAILYECLTGRPPFKAATVMDTIMLVITDEPVPPTQLNAHLPRDLETITLKCLQKEPGKRYASARDLAEDLGRFLKGEAIRARPVGALERAGKWVRRNRAVASLLTAVVLLLLGGIAVSSYFAWDANEQAKDATKARKEAEDHAEEETKAKELADERQKFAEKREKEETKAKRLAQEETARAEAEKTRAEEQLARAELRAYAGKLAQAQREWKDHNGPRALELLDECQWNLRGLEHRHLWTLFNSNQRTFHVHTGGVSRVAFNPDGKRILAGVRLLDTDTGQELFTLPAAVRSVAFSPDGKRILGGGGHNEAPLLKVWDADTGKELLSLKGHREAVMRVAFSSDGKRILSSELSTLKVWDADTGKELMTVEVHTGPVESVAFSPDGKRILSGGGQFRDKGKPWPGEVAVWDAENGKQLLTCKGHTDRLSSVTFSPDGKRILSGSEDKTLRVWDAETGQELFTLKGHQGEVNSVAFSPDGKQIISGSRDGTVKVWDAQKGQELLTLKGHRKDVPMKVNSRRP